MEAKQVPNYTPWLQETGLRMNPYRIERYIGCLVAVSPKISWVLNNDPVLQGMGSLHLGTSKILSPSYSGKPDYTFPEHMFIQPLETPLGMSHYILWFDLAVYE